MLSFFHLLFPSWKFFDQMGSEFQIEFRQRTAQGVHEWESIDLTIERKWAQLFFNPQGQLKLYFKTMVERFVHQLEILDDDEILQEPLYRQLPFFIEFLYKVPPQRPLQFRIYLLDSSLGSIPSGSKDLIYESCWLNEVEASDAR